MGCMHGLHVAAHWWLQFCWGRAMSRQMDVWRVDLKDGVHGLHDAAHVRLSLGKRDEAGLHVQHTGGFCWSRAMSQQRFV